MNRVRKGLIVALAVVLGLAATVGYNFLLDLQLAGYRGRKQVELKKIAKRDEQRPRVATHVADRDRILIKRFGDLPEALDVRTELELVRTWQTLLAGLFLPFGVGIALYIALARRPSIRQRCLRGAAVLIGAAHALPLLLLPDDARHFFRVFGLPLVIVALIVLAVCAALDRRASRRAGSVA